MKTVVLTVILIVTFNSDPQEKNVAETPHNEIKLNAFNLVVYQAIDLSYEYLQHENHTSGLGIFFKVNSAVPQDIPFRPEVDTNRNFSVTSYYRRYFSKKYAKGFFMEGFGMLSAGKFFTSIPTEDMFEKFTSESYAIFRFGLTTGVKVVSKKGFAIDIYFGVGTTPKRNVMSDIELVSRGGVSFGYRF